MPDPKVSVLLPAYNRANYISQAIQSILDQTYGDFEIIVVDDGSTDNTAEVVRRFTDPRVRYIYQENKGICGSLNTAFRTARGEHIALLGSDDIWFPQILELEVPILDQNPDVCLVYSKAHAMDQEDNPLPQVQGLAERYEGETFKSLIYGDCVCGITAVMRRDAVERAELWDETLSGNEDWDMWLRLSLQGRFYFIDEFLAAFRIHPGNYTGTRSDTYGRLTLDRIRVLDKVFALPSNPSWVDEMKPVAYRNVYIFVALRWLAIGRIHDSLHYFWKAIQVSPNPWLTPFRIIYLVLFYNFLSHTQWGTHMVSRAVHWRRKQINIRKRATTPPK